MQNRNRFTDTENKLMVTKEERREGRDTQGYGVNKQLYVKCTSNKALLYGAGNYSYHLIIT